MANSLEQRFYKELRNENFQSAKIVMCIYKKLLISCEEQMPLFASSLLSVMHILLDHTRQDELQIIGCETLFDFVNNQLAREVGEDGRAQHLRSAALQALSSMVWFMGEHSHISVEFDNIVSVVLENYGDHKKNSENLDTDKQGPQDRWVQEVLKNEGHVIHDSSPEVIRRVPSWRTIVNGKGEVNVTVEDARNPTFWSSVCLHNMAQLGKEATNIRRVLESLFRYFDYANLWSPEYGLAFSVLKDMQFLMDNSAMVHPDHEIRLGAHCIFSVVLVPSSVSLVDLHLILNLRRLNLRTLSRTVSVFSSSAALFEKLRKEKTSFKENAHQDNNEIVVEGEKMRNVRVDSLKFSYSGVYSVKNSPAPITADENLASSKETETGCLRLSSRQISLLLTSIWVQSISPANTPENYEAIAHTYGLVLLFSRTKNSSNESLIRSFQLAFSLRNMALNEGGPLPPSRRRSLFTLATSMILFSSKAYNIVPLVQCAKVVLTEKMVDPFLHLVDKKLKAVNPGTDHSNIYGSKEDDDSALKFLSEIDITGDQSGEFFAAEIVKSLANFPDSESSFVCEQLLSEFLPDDVCQLGGQFMDAQLKIEQGDALVTIEEDVFVDSVEGQAKANKELVFQNPNLLSVNQLIESVLDGAHQVGRVSVTAPDLPYKEMANHCETLLMGKRRKISNVMSAQMKQESLISFSPRDHDEEAKKAGNPFLDLNFTENSQKLSIGTTPMQCATEYQQNSNLFRLPSPCPYDNFLKAAGC
ncbi:hypothetical protein GH714_035960 [Hevea brasiliensis]|uniref:Uncharacterized protein n=1 Tax=Hevea brasiliensis TaxID=3981 RepID=A0A6A6KPM9_HEVBR|nr:hypothetical protein GH714_035960 [Hevea brasiliensis]